nr:hypothetical protein CFP56_21141 [Quercus suber]
MEEVGLQQGRGAAADARVRDGIRGREAGRGVQGGGARQRGGGDVEPVGVVAVRGQQEDVVAFAAAGDEGAFARARGARRRAQGRAVRGQRVAQRRAGRVPVPVRQGLLPQRVPAAGLLGDGDAVEMLFQRVGGTVCVGIVNIDRSIWACISGFFEPRDKERNEAPLVCQSISGNVLIRHSRRMSCSCHGHDIQTSASPAADSYAQENALKFGRRRRYELHDEPCGLVACPDPCPSSMLITLETSYRWPIVWSLQARNLILFAWLAGWWAWE